MRFFTLTVGVQKRFPLETLDVSSERKTSFLSHGETIRHAGEPSKPFESRERKTTFLVVYLRTDVERIRAGVKDVN